MEGRRSMDVADDNKISPMMLQWHDCKKKAPDAVLLFRLGDFYEAFYQDAIILSKELDITLTQRQTIPMAGVPAHTADLYIDRLVDKGHRVAIAEQMEDPRTVKGIVKRDIVRIVTPGSIVNSTLLSDKSHNFLASLHQINKTLGLTVVDLTTADLRVYEFDSSDLLFDELCRLRPKEMIVSKKCLSHHLALIQALKNDMTISLLEREDWEFDHQATGNFLLRHFRVHSLDSFGLQSMTCATSSAGALLSYIQNELHLSIDHVMHIQKEVLSKYMSIDSATQRHLELTSSFHEAQTSHTLLSLLDETCTPMGGRLLHYWLLHPLKEKEEIHQRQEAIECLLTSSSMADLQSPLSHIRDLERLIMKIETGYAGPRDIASLGLSLQQIPEAAAMLSALSLPPLLDKQVRQLSNVDTLTYHIQRALIEQPPLKLSEGHVFKAGYDEDLDELQMIQTQSSDWMAQYQTGLRNSTGIKTIKVGYTKVFGYYIEVSRAQTEKIPSDFERRQTLVNAERFITKELKEYEHKMLSAEERITHLESELFHKLRKEIIGYAPKIREIARAIAQIDCLLSLALSAKKHRFIKPFIDDSAVFAVEAGRHPVIEASLKGESFIPNDILLDDQDHKMYVITGPNMAGKSTFIRQVALLAILAQMGSFIPAKKAHIGIIDKVFTRIGASDNLAKGQSTFMVEMTETAHILHNATSKSLVILDEIGRGTSTYDGVSIAWAVAEYLLTTPGKTPKTLFATHYYEMTELEEKIPGVLNLHIAVHESEKGITFLRKIVKGSTDKSYGIHVARLAGLPAAVIKKAKEVLKTLEEKEGRPAQTPKKDKSCYQMSLFESFEPNQRDTDPVLIDLKELNPDTLSPMQALQKIIEWKTTFH